MWEQLRIIQMDILKLGGREKFKYEGDMQNFLGFEKKMGQDFQGACYRGV